MRSILFGLLLLLAPIAAHAAFLDCVFFDGFQSSGTLNGSAISAADARDGLAVHNCARKTVDDPAPATPMPLLTWNTVAAALAQTLANGCVYGHGNHAGYGQNIYASAGTGPTQTLADASLRWASEEPNYHYANNTCSDAKVCGHYTQIVWSTTTSVGCGQAVCTSTANSPGSGFPNWNFIVCNYSPPGNYIGQRPY